MTEIISSKRTIAKNSIMLYIRMLFAMVVGVYTSRVVLEILGETDFGIYSLIGGLISGLAFLNNTMSGASSRFLTFELGRNDHKKLSATLDSIIVIHLMIALLVLVIAETAGLWFVTSKLNIPPDRMVAAKWVFQATVVSTLLGIIQVPYTSLVIAREKMGIFAYFEILAICLKLFIVLSLKYIMSDKLIAYSVLLMLSSVIVFFCYRIYCLRHFEESKYTKSQEKGITKNLLSFFGLNLFGNFGTIFNDQALNVLVNKFFGLVYNAATGVATTLSNYVMALSTNTMTAYRPPVIKAYASGDISKMEELFEEGLKMIVYLFALFAVPVVVEADCLMSLWLKVVPPGAALFCRFLVAALLLVTVRHYFTIGVHATGKVKILSLCNGLLLCLNPFVIWLALRQYAHINIVYLGSIAANAILLVVVIVLLGRLIPELRMRFIVWSLAKILFVVALALAGVYFFSQTMQTSFWRLVASSALSTLILSAGGYLICLSPEQREKIRLFVKEKTQKFFKRAS